MFDPMIYEANGSSSACRRKRARQVETSTPPNNQQFKSQGAGGGSQEVGEVFSDQFSVFSPKRRNTEH